MIADCPHCFNRVYFPATGICPACHASAHSTEGADYSKCKFTIYESDSLPPRCYVCDAATERVAKWEHVLDLAPPTKSRFSLFSLERLLFNVVPKAAGYEVRMTINLPQCEACSSPPKAEHFDFDEKKATFIVHKDFAERVKAIRPDSK
jgi:hypothetical protein